MPRARATTAILIVIGVGFSGTPASSQSSPSARGEDIAQRLCARCHSIRETGASPMGLAPPFRYLSRRYPIENLAEALAEGIMVGHPAMPRFTFEPREIEALLTFISSLKPRDPTTPKQ